MTFSKKRRRKIVIEDKTYFWQATGNDGWIDLCVTGEIKGCQKLITAFEYQYSPPEFAPNIIYTGQFIVTPFIVRQVIIYALSQGWKPFEKSKDLVLPIADKIDLRIDKNMILTKRKLRHEISLRMTD